MTPESFGLLNTAVGIPSSYVNQAKEARKHREEKVRHFLQQRKLPVVGWSDDELEMLLVDFAQMDSNNFPLNCGVGEREARIHSGLVRRRHFTLGHGIGRSGDVREIQPKACGSSALNRLTNAIVLDLLRQLGARGCAECFVVPVATGMAMTLALLALRRVRPEGAKYVLWSRIDQKSCFKSIACAGFQPVVIELKTVGDELQTDLESMEETIERIGKDNIVAVMSTTSCFAPRAADDLIGIARLTKKYDLPHLMNNAYGIQSSKCMHLVEEAGKIGGKYDVFVQSTDKNFLVPVGGAVIAGFDKEWVQSIGQTYPGRASSSPTVDVFLTLMGLGVNGYKELVKERKENYKTLKDEMRKLADKYGERVLETKNNQISIAMTLASVPDVSGDGKSVSEVGSMLFTRGVSGTRVLTGKAVKTIEGHEFKCWGSHSDSMTTPYLTAASAIGMTKNDIELFIKRLDKVMAAKSENGGNKKSEHKKE